MDKRCPYCNNKIVTYRTGMTKIFRNVLIQLSKRTGWVDSKSLDISFSERTNAQKLQYWELIENDDKGNWRITKKGLCFVAGLCEVEKYVETCRGEIISRSEDMISFDNLIDEVQDRQDYQNQARVQLNELNNGIQGVLF